MKRIIPFLIALYCFIFVILEGTLALNLLPFISGDWMPVSHFLFIFLLYIAIFFERSYTYYAVILAIIFGLIEDIVYTDVIGVYLFSYTFVVYMVRVLMKFLQVNFVTMLLVTVFGVLAADIMVFSIYQVIQLHDMVWETYWQYRLLPTVLGNILVGLIIYFIFGQRLEKWSRIKFEEKE